MLPRNERLRRSRDFRECHTHGRSQATRRIAVCVLWREEGIRVGFSVGKRIGKAVTRNRVRRRLQHAVRQLLPMVRTSADITVTARMAAVDATYQELLHDVRYLFARHGLISEPAEGTHDAL